ncbi:TrkH family potassium uptake protein [Zhengella sp. ZM62]|uniref:TrkH family potassium uptake protein n=1 Tax=Zhengella sedimenti TaxID=3390035 RepID=UPI0039758C19
MDFRAVVLPIGRYLVIIAGTMLIPAFADLIAGNPDWKVFALSALCIGGAGAMVEAALSGPRTELRPKETFLLVNLAWFAFSAACAVPLWASGLAISYTDAFFEAASGLTTTGSTVLTGLDELPPGILLWRSLTQWIGGLGIVVIGIWLLPAMRIGGQQLFSIESSEKHVKPYGRVEHFVRRLLTLYGFLTIACASLYFMAGMTPFEAINHAFTTVSTGGFSTTDASMGGFDSLAINWIAIAFMALSSLPFLFLINLAEGRRKLELQQVTWFFALAALLTLVIFAVTRANSGQGDFTQFTHAAFNVVSVMSTTGYATQDYLLWGSFSLSFFFLVTFIGGCNGSTAGGFKIFRIIILLSFIRSRLRMAVRPNRISPAYFEGEIVRPSTIDSLLIFSILYAATAALFGLVYAAFGLDFETALSASVTALANVGPGIGPVIGPAGNFSTLPDMVKWLLSLEMILGRLEIIGGILILTPDFWRE